MHRLGLPWQYTEYVLSTESPEATVQQLLTARDAVQNEWLELFDGDKDALAIVRKVRVVLSKAVKASPRIFPHGGAGHAVTSSVARKVVLAMLSSGRATTDWASMCRAELEELCADQHELLKTFPETWSAADISNFIFGRPDWAIFVSLFGSLLRDAIKIPKVSLVRRRFGVPRGSDLRADRRGAAGSVRACRASRDRREEPPQSRPLVIRPTAVP